MSQNNAVPAAEEPLFRALLTPHRSLGRTGFAVLMGALLFGWAVTGAHFPGQGAWPVFGFFGLDVLLVYVAFRLNYRAARAREEVSVSRTGLDIRKVAPSGKAEAHRFNPFWARFSVARHDEIGITAWRSRPGPDVCRSAASSTPTTARVSPRRSAARWRPSRRG